MKYFNLTKKDQMNTNTDIKKNIKLICLLTFFLMLLLLHFFVGPRRNFNNNVRRDQAVVKNIIKPNDFSIYFSYNIPTILPQDHSGTFICKQQCNSKQCGYDPDCVILQSKLVKNITDKIPVFYSSKDLEDGNLTNVKSIQFYYQPHKGEDLSNLIFGFIFGMAFGSSMSMIYYKKDDKLHEK